MKPEELSALIEEQPRVVLTRVPTPLEKRGNMLIKRDDLTDLAFGGTKVRMLEFHLGEALRRQAMVLVTAGSPQSNFCRLAATAAARCGLRCQLLLIDDHNSVQDLQGNRLLSRLCGAEMVHIDRASASDEIACFLSNLRQEGVPFYFIDMGGHIPLSLWGYLQLAIELKTQLDDAEVVVDRVFLACGRGTTQAGLLLGMRLLGCPICITGVSVARDRDRCKTEISSIIGRFCEQYQVKNPVTESDIEIDDRWIGPGYEIVTPERWRIVMEQARRNALLLDPLYTSRATQALLEHGCERDKSLSLLVHTGGLPGLFDGMVPDSLRAMLS
jgi:1-aminocyclopropane-1-carboxylate deaminase/D-cysteine desulfhydrase-like pyridoxal-dependent ACC family enzyme